MDGDSSIMAGAVCFGVVAARGVIDCEVVSMYCGGGEAVPRAGRRGDGAARGPAGGAAWGWHGAAVWRAVRRGLGPAGVRVNFFRSVSFFFFCWVRAVQFFFS